MIHTVRGIGYMLDMPEDGRRHALSQYKPEGCQIAI